MFSLLWRKKIIGLANGAVALSFGMVAALAPPASAHTLTNMFDTGCLGKSPTTLFPNSHLPGNTMSIEVSHPSSGVYHLQTGVGTFANTPTGPSVPAGTLATAMSRFRLLYKINPSTFVSASVVPGTGIGLVGPSSVTRVNATGAADPGGDYIALSGGATIAGASPSGSNGSVAGLTAPAVGGPTSTTSFQLPAVSISTTANELDAVVATNGSAGKYGNPANFLTFLVSVSYYGVASHAATMCMPTDVSALSDSDIGSYLPLNGGAGSLHS
ncbi:hypothetical protein [Rhodococcus sp. BE178]|uniref:hypothetical protein n=1 Tax=Rhodococcus sp. BE178 TaxID=2817737 RepID=UPI003D19EAE5